MNVRKMAMKTQRSRSKSETNDETPIDFESALEEGEQVVRKLESGELGLSDSLAEYEEGIKKIKICHQFLEQAENRIAVLTAVEEDGTAIVEPVSSGDEEQASVESRPKRSRRVKSQRSRPPASDVDDSGGLF